jgi:hypothetical protein
MSEKIQKLKFRKFSLNSRAAIIGLIGSMAIMMTVSFVALLSLIK